MMIKTLFITGYRPHELGIFNDKHPGIEIIKKALKNKLQTLLDDGLEWVIVSGQLGVELWATEVVRSLKEQYPTLKYSVITPFLEQEKNWNEHKQEQYQRGYECHAYNGILCDMCRVKYRAAAVRLSFLISS